MRSRPLRPFLLATVVASFFLLAACGQQTQPTGFGPDYKANFMFGCHTQSSIPEDSVGGPRASKDYCECVYKGIVDKVGWDDAKKFEEQQADEDAGSITVPKNIKAVFTSCEKS